MANSIDIKTLKNILTSAGSLTVLDVRRKSDYEATPKKIAGATWCDPEKIDEWVKHISSGQPIAVYCVKGGSVSQSVVDRLRKEGREARFLEGGLKAWTESGQPVE
jgi:rhodanese-related sulfurtransferase